MDEAAPEEVLPAAVVLEAAAPILPAAVLHRAEAVLHREELEKGLVQPEHQEQHQSLITW